ncbi:MAG TPA: FAD-dependent oxidoreductase [Thermodesulfobacteriota bacterium]|nr:FAD-dependent oxidoreductase [Thermodesulfobacteriota bacterium]
MKTIVILGGGLAGLSTAWHLEKAEYRDYQLFEKESRVGGLTRSEVVDGFTFDFTGHLLHFKDKYVKDLILQLLGENINYVERNSWIYSNNVYTRYPFQTNTFGLPEEVIKECIVGFVEAKYGKNKNAGESSDALGAKDVQEEKTFEEWIYENFGAGIAKYFMIPYNQKLWTVHPREMTCEWMGRFVPQTSLEQILDGALSDQSKKIGYNAYFYYPLRGGIESLPKAFASSLSNIHVDSEAYEIDLEHKKITFKNGGEIYYDKLVSSIPLRHLVSMIKPLPVQVKSQLENLRYNSVFNINLGVDRNVSDKHWIYFPEPEYIFYRVGFSSNFSPFMAPEGTSSLYIEISYSDDKPLDKTKAVERVKKDLIKAQILRDSDRILVEKCFDIKCAYVIYDKNHKNSVTQIKKFLRENNIYTIGRYGSWEYSGMEDAILHGSKVVEEVMQVGEESYTLKKPEQAPAVSIAIPIYNEEGILEGAVREIIKEADKLQIDYELLLCENGSSDRTVEIANQLSKIYPQVRLVQYREPNYGKALKLGILNSNGRNIVCFEIDFWDAEFIQIAESLLKKYDAVVGSKQAKGARDRRPFIRRAITFGFNSFLRLFFGFQGTDTHGIKAFRRDKAIDIVKDCKTDKDIFATELILRMERTGFYMCEIPLEIEEKRPPSIKLFKRVPSTIKNLIKLWKATRNLKQPKIKESEPPTKASNKAL